MRDIDEVGNLPTLWMPMAMSCGCSPSDLGAEGPPHRRSSEGWCSLGPGGQAQVPPLAGPSLPESLAAGSASVSALCITSSAPLQGLSHESGQRFGALGWIYGTSSAAPDGNVPWLWPSRGGDFTAEPVCVREDGCSVPVSRGSSTAPASPLPFLLVGSVCKRGLSR